MDDRIRALIVHEKDLPRTDFKVMFALATTKQAKTEDLSGQCGLSVGRVAKTLKSLVMNKLSKCDGDYFSFNDAINEWEMERFRQGVLRSRAYLTTPPPPIPPTTKRGKRRANRYKGLTSSVR